MNVESLLATKGRDVATIASMAPIAEAVEKMREHRVGALVVTGDQAPLAGILSERDVVRALAERGAATLDARVSLLMTKEVTTCTPTTSVTDLMVMMTEGRIRHVPVVQEGDLVGLVSIGDVVKARLDELEHDKRDLLDYVSAR